MPGVRARAGGNSSNLDEPLGSAWGGEGACSVRLGSQRFPSGPTLTRWRRASLGPVGGGFQLYRVCGGRVTIVRQCVGRVSSGVSTRRGAHQLTRHPGL